MEREMLPCRCGCGELVPKLKRVRLSRGDPADGRAYKQGHQHNRIDPQRPEKRCSRCRITKPRAAFSSNRAQKDGLHNECRECANGRAFARRAENPLAERLRGYGLTEAEYHRLLEAQGGVCAICGGAPEHIDHDHDTGRVRGILCNKCNRGLGQFGDNEEGLMRALNYLRAA